MDHALAVRFGPFELRRDQRRLLQHGEPLALGARAFDLLVALVERRERVVAKNELLDIVWPGLVVEENNLQVQISTLRRLLGAQAIATIPGRGYRFTASIDGAPGGESQPATASAAAALASCNGALHRPTNLPGELPPLYGRSADLTVLRSLIQASRLVTVLGAGGIGKSRLAQAAAHALAGRWTDGAWMVELAGLSDPALVANAVAQTLGIALAGRGTALDELIAGLAQHSALLVLDNCEHVLDAAATLVQAVLRAAPGITLLCTSQEPLRLPTEQQYRVMPLAVPSETAVGDAREFGAVALFEARVRAVDPRFALDADSLALAIDICRRLDGLPLAIELAAARVATLGLQPVHDKLDARFRLLTGGSRSSLRRHQTLRAALAWSHHLLTDAEQAVFRRLGVFAGGFTMALAQAVAGDAQLDEWAVLDHLSALVDKSLVVADAGDAPRYRLLESARAFALEQLAAGDAAETLKRHALAIRNFFETVDGPNLDGELRTDQLRALLLPERDNLRAAHTWAMSEAGDTQTAVVLAACASALEDFAVESTEWLVPLQRPVAEGAVSPAAAARYWRAMASANVSMTGRVPRAVQIEAADRAQTLYRALDQPRRAFSSLTQLATHRMSQRDDAAAHAAAEQARGLMCADWPAMLRIRLLRIDAYLAASAGRFAEALALHQQELRVSVSTGDWLLEVMARENLVDLLWRIGPIEDAAREARSLVDELREAPLTALDMAGPFAALMAILSEMGRVDEASAAAREAMPLLRRVKWHYVEHWAHLFWRRGQLDTATLMLGASDARCARAGKPRWPNDQRLITEVRTALQSRLDADALASGLAAGAALEDSELFALLSEALAQPHFTEPIVSPCTVKR